MEEFNFVRHGSKMKADEVRVPIKESGLSSSQQEKWKEAVERLKLEDPEINYDSLVKIEALAQDICSQLPEKALLIFNSTNTPRTKLTADFLSTSVFEESKKLGKDIRVAYIWEPSLRAKEDGALMRTSESIGIPLMLRLMEEVEENDDKSLHMYLTSGKGAFAHPKEDELVMKAVNRDLASEPSFFKNRAAVLKGQMDRIRESFPDKDLPLYFYGIGHHGSLIALDVAFNGREKYSSVDEIPQPLSVWGVNLKNEN